MMRNYIESLIQETKSRLLPIHPNIQHPIPYFSQFECNDYWKNNACGMACLKMIMKYKQGKEVPLVKLANKCTKYGGYVLKKDDAEGLFYEPFCRFVKSEFNLNASVAPFLTLKRILFETGRENLVIASVSPEIRDKKNNPEKVTGGHLVLITGYNINNRTITIHNPSGSPNKSQKDYEMTFDEFKKFFAGRGIVVC